MNLEIIKAYSVQLAAITTAIVNNGAATKEASEAGKGRKDSLASSIRAYAADTARDGVASDEAGAALRLVLGAAEIKPGTIKGYGASFKGYRAMLAAAPAVDISTKNTKDAQDYVASDEVKALKVAKDRVKAATADYDLQEWLELANLLETSVKRDHAAEEATDEELADVAAAA